MGAEAPVEGVLVLRSGLYLAFARPPGLVESRFQWTVKAKDHEPALAWNRLHPVILHSHGCLGSEVEASTSMSKATARSRNSGFSSSSGSPSPLRIDVRDRIPRHRLSALCLHVRVKHIRRPKLGCAEPSEGGRLPRSISIGAIVSEIESAQPCTRSAIWGREVGTCCWRSPTIEQSAQCGQSPASGIDPIAIRRHTIIREMPLRVGIRWQQHPIHGAPPLSRRNRYPDVHADPSIPRTKCARSGFWSANGRPSNPTVTIA